MQTSRKQMMKEKARVVLTWLMYGVGAAGLLAGRVSLLGGKITTGAV